MIKTGIIRRVDDLGRIAIPKDIRRQLEIKEGQPMEVGIDNEGRVVLQKYIPGVIFSQKILIPRLRPGGMTGSARRMSLLTGWQRYGRSSTASQVNTSWITTGSGLKTTVRPVTILCMTTFVLSRWTRASEMIFISL